MATTNFQVNGTDADSLLIKKNEIYNSSDIMLWGWGDNGYGMVGTGSETPSKFSSPVQIGALTTWSKVGGSQAHSMATKTDGTLWVWGRNHAGQLGLGGGNYSSPVQVGALTNWSDISATGGVHSLALKTDGTLWAWGYNNVGQLGLGNISTTYSPVQVGTLTNWSKLFSGYDTTAAIKTDGTLWMWGNNSSWQLGQGNMAHRQSPVQVGTLTNWSYVAIDTQHTVAVKTDGTLWTWGYNYNTGLLGLGNQTSQSSPVQVGTLTNWSTVTCDAGGTLAIKTDGTLWAWGVNSNGMLGLGDGTTRNSPVQVGTLTNWSSVKCTNAAGNSSTLAIKTDGTLWAWGNNTFGQLGLGDTTHRSSPVQVGTLTTWNRASPHGWTVHATKSFV